MAIDVEQLLLDQRLWAEQYTTQYNARNNADDMKTQFLTLLVAQMKNQDPMNPVDNQDFVAQLAQFSSLEQLITINESVEKLVDHTKFESKLNEINEGLNGITEGVDYIASLLTYLSFSPTDGAAGESSADEG